ncbi:uncharacterized protein FOMMEDRAFT_159523 [Fomitiporia mediterranea MF3/22]|uniref:uncharacterized protein n=1 Tax=Fomitiporia mediterranea (strain MF3/22) TaxID=694068 RepID=UPI000440808B|nr:uncharacterized protein FOMMEDRAFT_159523 [Fomitiporia mediterranea MF3/22]EJC99946.1 hypothetical protein FOMMEDRAFT_159523 [Fomitiporia mediterranea MF3/22]
MDCKSVSLGRSGTKGDGKVEGVDGLNLDRSWNGGWGRRVRAGVGERIVPWEWSYMDIVASVCSSIAACAAEREECMELLKKSFSVGQQCGCVNANSNRKASVKQEGQRRRGNTNGGARSGRDGRDERQKDGRRWMSNYCAGYYEVDRLLTLYVEGRCSQLGGIIVRSEARRGHHNSRLERRVQ